jgi:hypothetical protein
MKELLYCKFYIDKEAIEEDPDIFKKIVNKYDLTVLRARESFDRNAIEYVCQSTKTGYAHRQGDVLPIIPVGV